MGRALILEEFFVASANVRTQPAAATPALPEEQRLEAFEQGYKAGWDDATTTQSEETGQLSADLASNLRDLAFTFHEARAHVLKGLEPLIREIVGKVLPDIARESLPSVVLERLEACLKVASEPPVILMVAPASRRVIEDMLPRNPGFPIQIREEPTLAEGQVFLRTGQIEEAIDIAAAVAGIQAAVNDFFTLNEGLQAHG